MFAVDGDLLQRLAANRRAFDMRALTDKNLYAHEYRGGPLHYLHLNEDGAHSSCLDSLGKPVRLTEHLSTPLLHGPWHLESAPAVFLSVIADGFYYTWVGRHEKHGPSETYQTDTFTLEELEALCGTSPLR